MCAPSRVSASASTPSGKAACRHATPAKCFTNSSEEAKVRYRPASMSVIPIRTASRSALRRVLQQRRIDVRHSRRDSLHGGFRRVQGGKATCQSAADCFRLCVGHGAGACCMEAREVQRSLAFIDETELDRAENYRQEDRQCDDGFDNRGAARPPFEAACRWVRHRRRVRS